MTSDSLPATMKAVVIDAPFQLSIQDLPVPELKHETDVLIKVSTAGICGSDLHIYRGHQPPPYGFIIGHEAVGRVVKVGSKVTKFKLGDKVIAPFSTSCGSCFYCDKGYTSRCPTGELFGNPKTAGAQAEFLRVPQADGCCLPAPDDIPEALLVLMCDILPTGYYVARNAKRLADEDNQPGLPAQVGLCAISSAITMFDKVFATDLAPHRLESAAKHGAIALPADKLKDAVLEATEGRGADAALEVVGHQGALLQAMDLVRPFGCVSSCGVWTEELQFKSAQLYNKKYVPVARTRARPLTHSLRFQFGRCSVQTFYPAAVKVLHDNQKLFETFIERRIGFDEVIECYELFEKNKIGKTVIALGE